MPSITSAASPPSARLLHSTRTFISSRKQLDSCGLGVPELKSVGEACVKSRSLIRW